MFRLTSKKNNIGANISKVNFVRCFFFGSLFSNLHLMFEKKSQASSNKKDCFKLNQAEINKCTPHIRNDDKLYNPQWYMGLDHTISATMAWNAWADVRCRDTNTMILIMLLKRK